MRSKGKCVQLGFWWESDLKTKFLCADRSIAIILCVEEILYHLVYGLSNYSPFIYSVTTNYQLV